MHLLSAYLSLLVFGNNKISPLSCYAHMCILTHLGFLFQARYKFKCFRSTAGCFAIFPLGGKFVPAKVITLPSSHLYEGIYSVGSLSSGVW